MRRDALWVVQGLNRTGDRDNLPLLRSLFFTPLEPDANLPPMPLGAEVVEDYRFLSLSLKGHPVSFLRAPGRERRPSLCGASANARGRSPRVAVAGFVLLRQRPGTAKGVVFMTIEDETAAANIIIWPKLFERQRAEAIRAQFIAITGRV